MVHQVLRAPQERLADLVCKVPQELRSQGQRVLQARLDLQGLKG